MKRLSLFSLVLLGIPAAYGSFQFGTTLPSSVTLFSVQSSCCVLAQPFTFTGFMTLQSINLDLGGLAAVPETLWLTDNEGPGTTVSDVLFQHNFTSPVTADVNTATTVSFAVSNLILAPGTYYLVLSSTSSTNPGGWGNSSTLLGSNAGLGSVAAFLQADTPGQVVDNSFPPDSGFVTNGLGDRLAFQLDGQVGTPEPATWLLCAAGVALLAARRYRLV